MFAAHLHTGHHNEVVSEKVLEPLQGSNHRGDLVEALSRFERLSTAERTHRLKLTSPRWGVQTANRFTPPGGGDGVDERNTCVKWFFSLLQARNIHFGPPVAVSISSRSAPERLPASYAEGRHDKFLVGVKTAREYSPKPPELNGWVGSVWKPDEIKSYGRDIYRSG